MKKLRGVRGAAGWCAVIALLYLLVRSVLYTAADALLGLLLPGASLARPVGVSDVTIGLIQLFIGLGAILLPLACALRLTRLNGRDLRLLLPAPWSPAFCLPVFLGLANIGNLAGALLSGLTGSAAEPQRLPSGGGALILQFVILCIMPAVLEELFFRGALQGLLRPSGSAAAIFGPALLFALLHLDLVQGLTALICGVFLGWLAERSGSILPGMLLHFINNTLAFLALYLRLYAPAEVSLGLELFLVAFFPLFCLWLLYHARTQGFRFSAGLRPGVDVLAVFSSPAYTLTVLFLLFYIVLF